VWLSHTTNKILRYSFALIITWRAPPFFVRLGNDFDFFTNVAVNAGLLFPELLEEMAIHLSA